MAESTTPIYHFPQWQPGDHGWGDSVNQAFALLENLINGLTTTLTAEIARAENSEITGPPGGWAIDDFNTALQQMLVVTQGFASWGEMAGVKTWQQIYDQNITWGEAANLTWGELCGLTTWQRVFDLYASWSDASSRNWGAL